MALTTQDVFEQRLDEGRPAVLGRSEGGLFVPAYRSDDDDPWRTALVNSLNRKHGLRRTSWPAARGPHRRCTPDERWMFQAVGGGR